LLERFGSDGFPLLASQVVSMVAFWCVTLMLYTLGVMGSEMVSDASINSSNAMDSRRLHDNPHCAHYDDCSKKHGRCCNSDLKCYRKDKGWAGCRWNCVPNTHYEHDPADHRTPWWCHPEFEGSGSGSGHSPAPPPPAPPSGDVKQPGGAWIKGMLGTHFWDCEAGDCDSSILRPFTKNKAVMPPTNAPADPAEHGGSVYGEKLWMTGAMSDSLSRFMGPNLLGYDDQYSGKCGGCGQCVLVRNPDSAHADWTVVVMKKVRCHPANPKCSGDQKTIDFAVPGFDHLQYSMANRCGKSWSEYTFLTREQSGMCGPLHKPAQCDCNKIPNTTPELKMMRRGCELFKDWNWHHGSPMNLEYKKVECPERMVDRFSGPGGFGGQGVIGFTELVPRFPASQPLGGIMSRLPLPLVGVGAVASLSAILLLALRRGRGRLEPELLEDECSS